MRAGIRDAVLAVIAAAIPSLAVSQATPTGIQIYQIIGDESHVWQMVSDVAAGEGGAPFTGGMESIVSITSSSDGQVLRYDHWEDGFEADIDAPVQATTLVLGDGDPLNGDVRSFSSDARLTADLLLSGTHASLSSRATSGPPLSQYVPIPRVATDVRFDGGDRLVATGGPVSVVHAQQPLGVPFVSGATEMFSREALAEAFSYSVPVGTDTFTRYGGDNTPGEPFKYVHVDLVAFDDGTQVSVDNGGGGSASFTLNRGDHWSSRGAINSGPGPAVTMLEGTSIQTSAPICAMLFTAGPGRYATRMYALLPDRMHDTDFLASAPGDDPGTQGSRPMNLYIFNPHPASITVSATDSAGTGSFTVPPRGTRAYTEAGAMNRALPDGSSARLTAPQPFWVVNAADYMSTAVDWGDALIGARFLSDYYPVGWAPGTGDPATEFAGRGSRGCDGVSPCDSLNRAPIFIAAGQDDTRVTVDFNGDGLADVIDIDSDDVPDPAPLPGNTYRVDALQVLRVFDPYDYDNAGTQVRANKPISATYAQDTDQGTGADNTLDLGYAILPYDQRFLQPVLLLDKAGDRSSVPSAGGNITFTLTLTAGDFGPITGISFSDLLPAGVSYVPGSTIITFADASTSNADPVVSGQSLAWDVPTAVLMNGESMTVTYVASLPAGAAATSYTNSAAATGMLGSSTFSPTASFTFVKTDVVLVKTVDRATAQVGDVLTYSITAINNGAARERNVVVSDPIPPGTSYVAGSATAGGTHDPAQNAVTWIVGNLNAGASVTLSFQVIVDATSLAGDIILNAAAFGSNAVADLRSLEASTTVVAPVLSATKSGPALVVQAGRVTYSISVRNDGSATATNVVLSDVIPALTAYAVATIELALDGAPFVPQTDAAGDDAGEFTGTAIVVTLPALAPGGLAEVRFSVDLDPAAAPPSTIANQARFGSAEVIETTTNLVQTVIDADMDGDTIPDGSDDCPTVPDPLQLDADGDGLGDACDACPNDATNDVDGDGVCEDVDNCSGLANPGQEDFDGDGTGDACECAGVPTLPDGGIGPSLRAAGKSQLTWAPVPGAARYAVHRGTIPRSRGMASSPVPYVHVCLGRLGSVGYIDADPLPASASFYYLIGVENDCSLASAGLGRNSLGVERPIPSCP